MWRTHALVRYQQEEDTYLYLPLRQFVSGLSITLSIGCPLIIPSPRALLSCELQRFEGSFIDCPELFFPVTRFHWNSWKRFVVDTCKYACMCVLVLW